EIRVDNAPGSDLAHLKRFTVGKTEHADGLRLEAGTKNGTERENGRHGSQPVNRALTHAHDRITDLRPVYDTDHASSSFAAVPRLGCDAPGQALHVQALGPRRAGFPGNSPTEADGARGRSRLPGLRIWGLARRRSRPHHESEE